MHFAMHIADEPDTTPPWPAPRARRRRGGDRLRRRRPSRLRDRPGWQRGRAVDLGRSRAPALTLAVGRAVLHAVAGSPAAGSDGLGGGRRLCACSRTRRDQPAHDPTPRPSQTSAPPSPRARAAPRRRRGDLHPHHRRLRRCRRRRRRGRRPQRHERQRLVRPRATDSVTAEVGDFLDLGCEQVDYGPPGTVGRLALAHGRRPPGRGARADAGRGSTAASSPTSSTSSAATTFRSGRASGRSATSRSASIRSGSPWTSCPAPGGTWDDVSRLARWAEPRQNHPRAPVPVGRLERRLQPRPSVGLQAAARLRAAPAPLLVALAHGAAPHRADGAGVRGARSRAVEFPPVPRPGRTAADLAERLLGGDRRALARAISLVENDDPGGLGARPRGVSEDRAGGRRGLHGAARVSASPR